MAIGDSTERLEFDLFGRDRSAGRAFDKLARSVDHAGDSVDGFGKDAKGLDAQIGKTETHLRELIAEFERTEDKTLFRDIRKDRSTLSLLRSMRKELGDLADDAETAGKKVEQAVSQGFLNGLPASPVLIGALVAVAAPLVAELGAMVGGAVMGAAGLGGIVGGVLAAAQDERVAEAGSRLGENFMAGFKDAGRILVNPILDQMATLQHAEDVFLADLAAGLRALAPVITPVAKGLEGLAENLDLDKVFGDSLPMVRAIAHELPEIGDALSDMFDSIDEGSDGATMGLITLFHIVEDLIRGTGEFIRVASDVYEWFVRTGDAATDFGLKAMDAFGWVEFIPGAGQAFSLYRDHLQGLNDETQSLIDGLDKAKDSGDDWKGSLTEQATSAREAAEAAKSYEDAVDSLFNKILGLKDAQLRYNLDLIKTREELKEGAKTLAINSEEGLKNQQAILGLIRDIKALREEHIANNMDVARANQLYEQQMNQLVNLAVQYGFDRSQVEQFAGSLRDVPKTVSGYIEVHNLDPSLKHAIQLNKQIDELDGKVARAKVITEFAEYRAGERNPSGRAMGGSTMAGQTYLVGENGPELRTERSNGYINSAAATRALLSGASGGSAVSSIEVEGRIAVDVTGADYELKNLFTKWLRTDAGFRATVKQYVGA